MNTQSSEEQRRLEEQINNEARYRAYIMRRALHEGSKREDSNVDVRFFQIWRVK